MVTMTVCSEVKRLYSSLQEMVGLRRRRRQLQISEPFNFKKETTILPGLTENEITVLREKAAASRLGIAHAAADSFAYTDTPRLLCSSSSSSFSSRLPPASSRRTISGPLPLSPTPPPRLSIPRPIPIPNNSRHGSSGGASSLRGGGGGNGSGSSTATGGASSSVMAVGGYLQQPGGKQGMKSVSMNDLDLLLFGDPSGTIATAAPYYQAGMGMGMGAEGAELVMPLPVSGAVKGGGSASFSSGMISPLELDDSFGGGGGRMDWDMEFDFQLGSPVSPLSPAEGGRKGFM